MITAVTGINWGDEGKGRIVDLLSEKADYVVRYQGGNNAGHTVVTPEGKYVLNLIPSGILHPEAVCVLGGGMVVDLDHLRHEMSILQYMKVKIDSDNLRISDKATICMPFHVRQDVLEEERLLEKGAAFGSTRRGIAYAYGDKYMKKTLRMGDLLNLNSIAIKRRLQVILESKNLIMENVYGQNPLSFEELYNWCESQAEYFRNYICDTGKLLNNAAEAGKNILFEAQLGALRDIDYGIYPYTSSSNTIAAYAPIGAGIPQRTPDRVVGVMKAYSTCVGEGPFAAEDAMPEEWNNKLRNAGGEFGAATGRPRRVGPFDAVASRYGIECQGADDIALTKLDVLSEFDTIPVVTAYELDGHMIDTFPADSSLERVKPVVEEYPGWHCDISGCTSWEELPKEAREYVLAIEKLVNHRIYLVSTGAERSEYITIS